MLLGMGFEVSKEQHHFEFSLFVAFVLMTSQLFWLRLAMPVCCCSFPLWW